MNNQAMRKYQITREPAYPFVWSISKTDYNDHNRQSTETKHAKEYDKYTREEYVHQTYWTTPCR